MKMGKYSQKNLLDAVNAVRQGALSYRRASKKYGVPVMTIQNRVSGKIDDSASPGRPTALPHEVELQIIEKLKQAAEMGFGITRRMLAVRVGRIVRRLGLKTPFKNGVPGKDWLASFMERHKDISLRKPTALSTVRARMLNQTVTDNYFSALLDILNQLEIRDKPRLIWNIDETSVPLLHKPAKVIGPTGLKNIPGRVGNSRDNVSVLACVNAAGGEIPPQIIVKGKTYKSLHAYNTNEGVPGSVYTWQERAWMEDGLGELWFRQHFLKHCGPDRPQLILLDSHSSHETLGLIEACISNDIALLTFPPHTTQWLCPLDKTVFGPLSRAFSRICSEFMATSPNNMVTKWEWPRLFRLAHDEAFTSSNIESGFKKCGIFPLNREALPSSATAPSLPFDVSPSVSSESISSNLSPRCPTFSDPPAQLSVVESSSSSTEAIPQHEVVSEQEFIDSVLAGNVPFSVDEEGNIQLQISVMEDRQIHNLSVSCPTTSPESKIDTHKVSLCNDENVCSSMSNEVSHEFSLPVSDRIISKPPSSRKLTSHRILTSSAIYNIKKEKHERKEKMRLEKEERKNTRLLKKKSYSKNVKKGSCVKSEN